MGVPLQLNTGKLLNDSYISQLSLATTLDDTTTTVTTGNLEALRFSKASVMQITMNLLTEFTSAAADATKTLQIQVFRNNETPAIYDETYSLVPFSTADAAASLNVPFTFTFIDETPSANTAITGNPVEYNIQFTVANLVAGDSLLLDTLSLLSFEEIENPNALTLTVPLT